MHGLLNKELMVNDWMLQYIILPTYMQDHRKMWLLNFSHLLQMHRLRHSWSCVRILR